MKRALTIILIILLIIATILTVSWAISRKRAVNDDKTPLTFRQFLGIGGRGQSVPEGTDGLTPETPVGENPGTPENPATPGGSSTNPVAVSQFTSGPLTPSQTAGTNDTPINQGGTRPPQGSTTSGGTGGNTGGGVTTTGGGGGTTGGGSTTAPTCSDADVTIAFTADEIARLNALQNRFYTVATTLYTDAAVQAEVANYTTFKTKANKATELYNYCAAVAPRITSAPLQTKVATPFWRDITKDKAGYMPNSANGNTTSLSGSFAAGPADPRNIPQTQVLIQKIFKLNLW